MNTKRFLLMLVVLTIFIVWLAFASSTHADPGSPFWSVYVGNSWTYYGYGNVHDVGTSFSTSLQTNEPRGIEFVGGYLYVSKGESPYQRIYKYDTNGNLNQEIYTDNYCPSELCWDGSYFWHPDTCNNQILKIDSSGTTKQSFPSPYNSPVAIAWDGSYLWVSFAGQGNKIFEMTTSGALTGNFITVPTSDYPSGLVFVNGRFWVSSYSDANIYQIDISGNVLSSFSAPGTQPAGLAFDGQSLWHTDIGTDMVYKINISSWTWLDEIVESDTTTIPEVKTYRHDSYLDGWYEGSEWYSISSTEMKLWKEEFWDFEWITTTYDGGLVVGKNPIPIVGDYWTSDTTGTVSGSGNGEFYPPWSCPVDVNFEVTVLDYEFVTTPLGSYKAYKMRYIYHLWNYDESCYQDASGTYYQWIVPYLGIVKWQSFDGSDTEALSSMTIKKEIVDYDSDAKTDMAVYRSSDGAWYVNPSGGGSQYGVGWGGDASDKPAPGDYDGDGKIDIAVYRVSNGEWYIVPSSTGTPYGVGWGGDPTDKPVPGDYDGDAKTDIAIYRTSIGAWYINPSSGASPHGVGWGGDSTDIPIPGDYDGDGMTDIAVYRTSTGAWYVIPSGGGSPYGFGWGGDATDKPAPGDYDGDGKTDIAIYRTSTGVWYVIPSGGGSPYGVGWGGDATDKPVPGDYDGDGMTDIAVYRTSIGGWYVIPSSGGSPYGMGWGGDVTDKPVTMNLSSIE